MMARDVAIVSFAQSPSADDVEETETQLLFPVITEAIERSGIPRDGHRLHLLGQRRLPGRRAVRVRRQPRGHRRLAADLGVATWRWTAPGRSTRRGCGSSTATSTRPSCSPPGISSRGDLREVLCLQNDPYYLMPLWADHVSLAALQARALLDAGGATEADLAEVAARSRRNALGNPYAQVPRRRHAPTTCSPSRYVVAPLRAGDCPPVSDGAAAVVLVAGDRAREVCERPAWIRGIDHRIEPHYPGVRDLTTSESTRLAGEHAGVGDAPVEVAELSATFSHEELILREALGLGDDVEVNPSGGALAANPLMVTGLIRIGEAFRQINEHGQAPHAGPRHLGAVPPAEPRLRARRELT